MKRTGSILPISIFVFRIYIWGQHIPKNRITELKGKCAIYSSPDELGSLLSRKNHVDVTTSNSNPTITEGVGAGLHSRTRLGTSLLSSFSVSSSAQVASFD